MSDSGWGDYLSDDTSGAEAPIEGGAQAVLDDASNDVSDAANASDWGDWQAATGDEQAQSADSYVDAAAQDYQDGFSDAGDQMLYDAGAEAGLARDS